MALAAARIEPMAPLSMILESCAGVNDTTRVLDLPEDVIDSLERHVSCDLPVNTSTFCEWLVMQAMDPTESPLTVGQLKARYC
ncbi:hypothetical protein [Luteibacter sp.]|uniref:hypothetical protein n=1 Tax=Luteibacter sp. TaxID=1886636 RepID=UPI003F809CEA